MKNPVWKQEYEAWDIKALLFKFGRHLRKGSIAQDKRYSAQCSCKQESKQNRQSNNYNADSQQNKYFTFCTTSSRQDETPWNELNDSHLMGIHNGKLTNYFLEDKKLTKKRIFFLQFPFWKATFQNKSLEHNKIQLLTLISLLLAVKL